MGNQSTTTRAITQKNVLKKAAPSNVPQHFATFTCTMRDTLRELTCKVTFQADSLLLVLKNKPAVLVRDDHFHYCRGVYTRQIEWRGMQYIHVTDQLVRCHFAHRREEPFVEFVFKDCSNLDRFVHRLCSLPFLHKVDHGHFERHLGKKRFASFLLANSMLKQRSPVYLVNLAFVGFNDVHEHNIRTMDKTYSAIIKEVIKQLERSVWQMRYIMNYHKPDSTVEHVVARFGEFVDSPLATSDKATLKEDTTCPIDTNNNKGTRSLMKLCNSFTRRTNNVSKLKR